tara:strand:- start:14332 stop:15216 length:885 start_codon:yes stop_codon:yes gene_type:complete
MASWKKVVLEGDITATAPVSVSSSALSLSVSGLSDAGTPAGTDKVLLWNGSVWETVDASEFLGGSGSITINNNSDNNLLTASGTSNTLNGESNLTYSTDLRINSGSIILGTNNNFLKGISGTSIRNLIGYNSSDDVIVGGDVNSNVSLVGKAKADYGIEKILTSTSGISNAGDFGIGAEIIRYGSTATAAGRLYYLNTSGSWSGADNSQSSSATPLLAVAAGNNSGTAGMIIRGMLKPASILNSPSIGEHVYLGTGGQFDANAPTSSGSVKRALGHLVTSGIIYFNPSVDFTDV